MDKSASFQKPILVEEKWYGHNFAYMWALVYVKHCRLSTEYSVSTNKPAIAKKEKSLTRKIQQWRNSWRPNDFTKKESKTNTKKNPLLPSSTVLCSDCAWVCEGCSRDGCRGWWPSLKLDLNRKVMLSSPDNEVKDIKVTEVINGCNTDLKIQIDLHYTCLPSFCTLGLLHQWYRLSAQWPK